MTTQVIARRRRPRGLRPRRTAGSRSRSDPRSTSRPTRWTPSSGPQRTPGRNFSCSLSGAPAYGYPRRWRSTYPTSRRIRTCPRSGCAPARAVRREASAECAVCSLSFDPIRLNKHQVGIPRSGKVECDADCKYYLQSASTPIIYSSHD